MTTTERKVLNFAQKDIKSNISNKKMKLFSAERNRHRPSSPPTSGLLLFFLIQIGYDHTAAG
jgi:hypothetical protein